MLTLHAARPVCLGVLLVLFLLTGGISSLVESNPDQIVDHHPQYPAGCTVAEVRVKDNTECYEMVERMADPYASFRSDRTVEVEIHKANIVMPHAEDVTTPIRQSEEVVSVGAEQAISQPLGSYRVQQGDSLYLIAQIYDVSVHELRQLNQLSSDIIRPGQALAVPTHSLREYPVGVKLTDKEVEWMARMIHAEARGEPYLGQVAVGAVILNRLKSRQFPNTLRAVLFQPNAFQPIRNRTFFQPANEMAYRAAREALQGHDPTGGALFFFNPRISSDRFMHARPAVMTIGDHRFMY